MGEPAYLALVESGELAERVEALRELMAPCRLCPRRCHVNRTAGETGFCRAGPEPMISSYGPHFGEEAPLVGVGGSGTIFLTHCNLGCVFCQNYDISREGLGHTVSIAEVAQIMLELQERGCHNVNLVTPTHYVPVLVEALGLAAQNGLRLPVVYNCGGYESLEALQLLDGIIDIYMPDAKYADPAVSAELSGAADYPQRVRVALAEMYRQVGPLQLDERGIAVRGLLVRHLVLPEGLAGTARVMQFLARLDREMYVNVMAQYHPCYRAHEHARIARRITAEEYEAAVRAAREAGLHRLDKL